MADGYKFFPNLSPPSEWSEYGGDNVFIGGVCALQTSQSDHFRR